MFQLKRSINCDLGRFHFGGQCSLHYLFKCLLKCRIIFGFQAESGRVFMSAKLHQMFGASLERSIYIKARNRSSRSRIVVATLGKYQGWAMIGLDESRSHNSNHAFVPIGLKNYRSGGIFFLVLYNLSQGFLGNGFVQFFSIGIELLYFGGKLLCLIGIKFTE